MSTRERLLEMAAVARGPTRLVAQIREHADIIDGLRARGVPWNQVSEILAEAGIRRLDGRPIPAGDLSSMVSRLTRRATTSRSETTAPPVPATPAAGQTTKRDNVSQIDAIPDVAAILAEGQARPHRSAMDIDEFLRVKG